MGVRDAGWGMGICRAVQPSVLPRGGGTLGQLPVQPKRATTLGLLQLRVH